MILLSAVKVKWSRVAYYAKLLVSKKNRALSNKKC